MGLTLAEQIASLTKAPEDYDIENEGFGDGLSGDEAHSQEREENSRDHYVQAPKSRLRQANLLLEDEKYQGRKASRQELFSGGNGHKDAFGSDEDASEADGDSEDSEVHGSSFDSESLHSDASTESHGESEDDGEDREMHDAEETQNTEADSRRAKLLALMDQEKHSVTKRINDTLRAEASKGFRITRQQAVFDGLVDSRIAFQKALTEANRLPLAGDVTQELLEETGTEIQPVKDALYSLLDEVVSTRRNMMLQDGVAEKLAGNSGKHSLEAAIETCEQFDRKLETFRESTLNKWSAKVQSASGLSALQSSKFRAINQSAAVQVSAALADVDRLVERTQLNRSGAVPLGYEGSADGKTEKSGTGLKDSTMKEKLEYIFDDTDFYRLQLREFVDKKVNESSLAGGQFKIAKSKVKKVVDTRASKGRKLRYHVQEKLENFEAPQQTFTWTEDQIDELFSGLLGRRIRIEEQSEAENSSEEEAEEDEIQGGQGLQIFA